jgi:hypothetical protein
MGAADMMEPPGFICEGAVAPWKHANKELHVCSNVIRCIDFYLQAAGAFEYTGQFVQA